MTRKATPTSAGEAYCPRCRRPDIRTVLRDSKEVYVMHDHVPGLNGGVNCHNSGQPVVPPMRPTR